MNIPTEPIGSIPRPCDLRTAIDARGGNAQDPTLEPFYEAAVRDTIKHFEATGSPVITDGTKIRARIQRTALAAAELGLSNVA